MMRTAETETRSDRSILRRVTRDGVIRIYGQPKREKTGWRKLFADVRSGAELRELYARMAETQKRIAEGRR